MKAKSTLATLALAAITLTLTPARAADGTWLGTSGNWSAPATWSGGIVADGADFTAYFTGVNITANQTVTVDAPRTIGNITFTDATTASHNLTLSGANALTLAVTTGSPVINVTQSGRTVTLSSELAGDDGLTKSGAGQLILSGANTSFSGSVSVNAGILALGNTGALGSASGLTLAGGSRLIPSVDGVILSLPITLGAAGTTATINAPTPGGTGGVVYTLTLNGAISGAGNLTLNGSNGSNTYGTIVFGTASSYTGSTLFTCSVGGATFFGKLGIADALPTTTVLTMDGGAGAGTGRTLQLDLNGNNQTLAGLTNITRNLRNQRVANTSATAATLTINNSEDNSFSGLLGTGGTNFGLTKSGTGTFTISRINTYTGATTINNGKLVGVTGGSCAASSVTVATTTGTMGVAINDNTKVWTCANLTFAAAGALDFTFGAAGPSDIVAPLVVTDAVDFTATPSVIVSGASLATLPIGSYPLMTWASVTGTTPTSVLLPPTMEGNLSVTDNTLSLNITKASALPLYWAVGDGAWDINTSFHWKDGGGTASTYQESLAGAAAVVFDDFSSGPGPGIAVNVPADVAPSGLTFDHSTKNFTLSGPGAISGTTGLAKLGTGTLTLATSTTYAGATTISDGTLKLGAADRIPDGTGKGNLTVDGTLDLNGFSETVNGLSGYGTVDTVSGGSPVLTVGNGNASSTFDGVIRNTAGTLTLAKTGTGTLTLAWSNTYSGGTEIAGGIVNLTDASALGTGTVTFNGGVRLVVGTGLEVANPITMGPNTGVVGRALAEAGTSAGTATLSGPITINNSAVAGGHFAAPTAGTILHVAGTITSAVPIVSRIGTVMYSGGGTGYTDLTIIQNTIMVGATNGIATTATIFCGSAGAVTLDLNGFNQSLVGIAKGVNAATIGNSSTTTDSTLTTTGTSLFAGVIQDVLGLGDKKVNLTVNGGELTLAGANTYTGATTISAGTLALGASNTLADTTPVAIGSATLTIGAGFTDTVGTLDTTGTATINLSAGATLAFDDSSGIPWAGTLNLTGTFVSGASLRFGITSGGLKPEQLALISAPGFGSFALNPDGFLTASTTGGYAIWAATHAPTGTAKDDYDGDGVSNGVEYVLGGTKDTNDLGKLPKVSVSGGTVLFTFERDQASINGSTTVVIEVGPDLTTWPGSYAVPDGAATTIPGVSVTKDTPTTGFDTVTLSLPLALDATKFARLKVTVP